MLKKCTTYRSSNCNCARNCNASNFATREAQHSKLQNSRLLQHALRAGAAGQQAAGSGPGCHLQAASTLWGAWSGLSSLVVTHRSARGVRHGQAGGVAACQHRTNSNSGGGTPAKAWVTQQAALQSVSCVQVCTTTGPVAVMAGLMKKQATPLLSPKRRGRSARAHPRDARCHPQAPRRCRRPPPPRSRTAPQQQGRGRAAGRTCTFRARHGAAS